MMLIHLKAALELRPPLHLVTVVTLFAFINDRSMWLFYPLFLSVIGAECMCCNMV